MKGTLKLILSMLIPLAEAQGELLESDGNPQHKLIGEGLVYIGHFAQFLLDRANGKQTKPPVVPASVHS